MMDEQKRDLTSFTAAISKMIAKNESSYNLTRYGRNRHERVKEYTLEEIKDIIDSGSVDAQIILSRNYFERGGFYWRLLMHYATLLKYTGLLIPNPSFGKNLSESYITKKYYSAVSFIDKANLPDLFTHIGTKVLRDGSYYGVIQEVTDKSISILDLPIFYCRSRFKDKEGNDIIEFNVTYFDTIHDEEYRKKALAAYPSNVVNWYRRWKARKVKSPWCYISTSVGICMSLIDERPVFLNIIAAELEYEDAKDINKERDLEEIRKILIQHIPHLTDGGLLFEPDEAEVMHQGAVNMMKGNKNLSIFTTYADVDSIVSKTAAEANNNVIERMGQNVYSKAGVSSHIFAAIGSQTILISIKKDISVMMILARKFQAFLTRVINSVFEEPNVYYSYTILPISLYTQSDYITDAFKLAQSGYSYLIPGIALGIDQKQLISAKDLENNLLDVSKTFSLKIVSS